MTPVEEGSDGTGAPGEQLWEPPNRRTAYWFGFVCTPMDWPTSGPYSGGTGEITGQARNWVEWAPYTVGTYDTPVDNPFIALTDAANDQTVFQGRGDENGNFDIQNVPAGRAAQLHHAVQADHGGGWSDRRRQRRRRQR
jgi:hypothetical protein